MIRKGTVNDIGAILKITRACTNDMISKNIFQWNDLYPNKTAFLNDANREELYVLEAENKLIGCITLSSLMDAEYVPIKWLTPNLNNLYVHRLAIHPQYQAKGFAQRAMDFAEDLAIKNNYVSIRLDTFSMNPRNVKFYELRDFIKTGEVYFPKQSEHPFYCYELVL